MLKSTDHHPMRLFVLRLAAVLDVIGMNNYVYEQLFQLII